MDPNPVSDIPRSFCIQEGTNDAHLQMRQDDHHVNQDRLRESVDESGPARAREHEGEEQQEKGKYVEKRPQQPKHGSRRSLRVSRQRGRARLQGPTRTLDEAAKKAIDHCRDKVRRRHVNKQRTRSLAPSPDTQTSSSNESTPKASNGYHGNQPYDPAQEQARESRDNRSQESSSSSSTPKALNGCHGNLPYNPPAQEQAPESTNNQSQASSSNDSAAPKASNWYFGNLPYRPAQGDTLGSTDNQCQASSSRDDPLSYIPDVDYVKRIWDSSSEHQLGLMHQRSTEHYSRFTNNVLDPWEACYASWMWRFARERQAEAEATAATTGEASKAQEESAVSYDMYPDDLFAFQEQLLAGISGRVDGDEVDDPASCQDAERPSFSPGSFPPKCQTSSSSSPPSSVPELSPPSSTSPPPSESLPHTPHTNPPSPASQTNLDEQVYYLPIPQWDNNTNIPELRSAGEDSDSALYEIQRICTADEHEASTRTSSAPAELGPSWK